jgi:hypothetical protein
MSKKSPASPRRLNRGLCLAPLALAAALSLGAHAMQPEGAAPAAPGEATDRLIV